MYRKLSVSHRPPLDSVLTLSLLNLRAEWPVCNHSRLLLPSSRRGGSSGEPRGNVASSPWIVAENPRAEQFISLPLLSLSLRNPLSCEIRDATCAQALCMTMASSVFWAPAEASWGTGGHATTKEENCPVFAETALILPLIFLKQFYLFKWKYLQEFRRSHRVISISGVIITLPGLPLTLPPEAAALCGPPGWPGPSASARGP